MVTAEQHAVEVDADRVVDRAREHADAVLEAVRENADDQLAHQDTSSDAHAIVTEARIHEDAALQQERASADERLRLERERNRRALLALLPLERETTDRHLLSERVSADDAVSHRDNFLGMVSHDLRDLLGGVVTTAGMLSTRAPDTEEGEYTRSGAARIQRYAARMNRLIGDLVDIASIDAGKLAVSPSRGDVSVMLAEAVETFQAAASAGQVSLTLTVAERPLLAEFDYERMLQVVANLITNAIKFTPAEGAIQVRGERAAGQVRLSVTDTGTGIPPALLDAVFERFRQVTRNDRRGLASDCTFPGASSRHTAAPCGPKASPVRGRRSTSRCRRRRTVGVDAPRSCDCNAMARDRRRAAS